MIKDFVLGSIAGSSLVLLWVYSHKDCFSSYSSWATYTCPTIFICPAKVFDNAEELEEKAKENLDDVVDKSKEAFDNAKESFKESFDGEKEVANNADENVEKLAGSKKSWVKVIKTNEDKMSKGEKTKGKKRKPKKKTLKPKKSIENKKTNDVTNDNKDRLEDFFKDEKDEDFSLASLFVSEVTEDLLDMKEHLKLAEGKVEEIAVKLKENLEESNHTEDIKNIKTPNKIKEVKKPKEEKKTSRPAWK